MRFYLKQISVAPPASAAVDCIGYQCPNTISVMSKSRAVSILTLFMVILLTDACGGGARSANQAAAANSVQENSNAAKTNVEELGMLVNVPYEAEDIVWKEDSDKKSLKAVLRFSPEDAAKLVAEATTQGTPQNVTLSSETWFPAELIAQSDMTGDDTLHAIAYPANTFFQDPYAAGRILRVDGTDYFVLELSKK